MKTLLVLAAHPDLAEAIRAAVSPEHYRIIHRVNLDDAEPFTARGLVDLCLVDAELTGVQAIWLLEKVRRRLPQAALIVCSGVRTPEWEEEAYLQGASHVLAKPIRPRLLNSVLDRLRAPSPSATPESRPAAAPRPEEGVRLSRGEHTAAEALAVLRNF